jgi:hypothetical protein
VTSKTTQRIAAALIGIDRDSLHRSIGRFVFELSQLEYSLKHYLFDQFDTARGHDESPAKCGTVGGTVLF